MTSRSRRSNFGPVCLVVAFYEANNLVYEKVMTMSIDRCTNCKRLMSRHRFDISREWYRSMPEPAEPGLNFSESRNTKEIACFCSNSCRLSARTDVLRKVGIRLELSKRDGRWRCSICGDAVAMEQWYTMLSECDVFVDIEERARLEVTYLAAVCTKCWTIDADD